MVEGTNIWLQVLTDLELLGQGYTDSLVDNLKGFPEAISTIFPVSDVQL